MSALRYLLVTAVILVSGIFVLSFWLLRTDSGASFLWARAVNAVPDTLSARSVSGNLRQGIVLHDARYKDSSVDVKIGTLTLAAEPELFGWTLNVDRLHASSVTVKLQPKRDVVERAETAAPLAEVLPSLQLPLTLRLPDVLFEDAALLAPDGAQMFAFESLAFAARWDDALTVESLRFANRQVRVLADASLALDAPYSLRLDSEFDNVGPGAGWLPESAKLQLSGTSGEIDVVLDSTEPAVQVSGRVNDPFEEPGLDLALETARLDLPLEATGTPLLLTSLTLRLAGSVDAYRASLETRLHSEVAGSLDIAAAVTGDSQSLQVDRLTVTSDDLEADASGSLAWAGEFAASASLDVQRFDLKRYVPTWPEGQFVNGQAALMYRGGLLELVKLDAAHSASDAVLAASGMVNAQDGSVDIDLTWQDLQWPVLPATAEIDSRAAKLSLAGQLDDWTLQGDIALGAPDLPQGSFLIFGEGDSKSLALQIRDSAVLGGKIVGQLSFDAGDGGRWSAELQSTDTRITPLAPEWPGEVSANVNASGVVNPFSLDLNIVALTGNVRSRELSANGRLQLAGDTLRFKSLTIQSGSTNLTLDGDWQDAEGVLFSLDSKSMGDLLPGAAGSLQADGALRAGGEWPLLSVSITGKELGFGQFHVAEVQLDNKSDVDSGPLTLTIGARDLVISNYSITTANLSLRGSPSAHRLEIEAQSEGESLALALQGGVDDAESLQATRWRGDIKVLEFRGDNELKLALRDPAALEIGLASATLGQSCIDVNEGGALCLAGQLLSPEQYRTSFTLTDLPLDLLRSFTNTNLKFDQLLSGAMEVATGPRGRPSGSGRIDISPGTILNVIDDSLTLRTRSGFVAFDLQDGQLLAGELSLPFSDAAEISGTFRVLDIQQGQESPISGQLSAFIRDLGVGARILPQIAEAGGSLDADISIAGTLGAPNFAGGLAVENGNVVYEPLGLALENIQLNSQVLANNRVELTTTFDAGEGSGRISSSADYLAGRDGGFEVSLQGENLSVIDLPDLKVVINPDLELGIRGDDIRIGGQVAVPTARVASVAFFNSGVSESDNVVYVGPVQPPDSGNEEEVSPLNYSGSVLLELGDNVAIDLDVAEARLRGKATYRWDGDALPLASGNFAVSGKFEAYGQLLEITEGTIRYANVPASNPQLRIRAEREIFGNSQVRNAGVLVSGTAMRPQFEVYTTPATSPDRALTLLATGSDFNYDQGVGALDVGTYIAPKLYASYGIGLFDSENVISVRYDLSKGFGIKGTSGKEAAGIDISYTIER